MTTVTVDLEQPIKFAASAEHARDYTFYIIKGRPWYNEKAFQANPNCVAGSDLYLKTTPVPDADGSALYDYKLKCEELKKKMGDEVLVPVKVVVLATAKGGTRNPTARLAALEETDMVKDPPVLKIHTEEDLTSFVAEKRFQVLFEFKGLETLTLRCEPPDVISIPKNVLKATEKLDLVGNKASKATVFATGFTVGGKKMEQSVTIEITGPELKIKGTGFIAAS